jgi:hypothetical protein
MTPWEIALQVLKFVSLGVSTASGWYATLSDTRDKDSHKLTRAGRVVFTCLIASSVIALLSQTLETKNTIDKMAKDDHEKQQATAEERRKEKEAAAARSDQLDRLSRILETADKASASSETSAKQSAVAVARLSNVIDAEDVAKENTWRVQRPFGTWQADLTISGIPITESEKAWVNNALKQWKQENHASLTRYDHPQIRERFENKPEDWNSGKVKSNVFVNLLDVGFHSAAEPMAILPHYNVRFYPEYAETNLQLDQGTNVTSVDISVRYKGVQKSISTLINNWVDLYGSWATVDIFGPMSRGQTSLVLLSYWDTITPRSLTFSSGKYFLDKLDEKYSLDTPDEHRTGPHRIIANELTEEHLGIIPEDYQKLFPMQTAAIRARIQQVERSQSSVNVR